MTWKFRVTIKDVYKAGFTFRQMAFNKCIYTWHDAWVRCIDESIKGLSDTEVIFSIEALNDIVRCGK